MVHEHPRATHTHICTADPDDEAVCQCGTYTNVIGTAGKINDAEASKK